MPGKIREILIAFGFAKQTNIATANTVAHMWRLGKLNTSFLGPTLNTESDAAELGKGNEFATQVFKTSWDVKGQIEKYLSSGFGAWAVSFGLGTVTPGGGTPNFIYTCIPLDPVSSGLELPYFSFVEQIRPGATAILDRMAIGCAIEGWNLSIASGPGRANSKLVVDIVGSGKHLVPSGIAIPAATAELLLPSSSISCEINGVDYVTNKNIVSLDVTWKNNLHVDSGFFPGSGMQGADTQVERITLTGTGGTANVTLAGGLTKLATFGTSLTLTAGAFVTSWLADYDAQGIVISSDGPEIIFTAKVAGTGFTAPAIANVAPNLAGTVDHVQGNIASGSSGAIRGRLEVGDREAGLTFVARFDHNSYELTKLKGQNEGTAVISLTYDANNSLQLTYHRCVFSVAELGETDGILTVQVTVTPLWHVSNGLLTAVAKCNTAGIAAAE